MSEVVFGSLISGVVPERDCVHVAVCPVEVMESLLPGARVGFWNKNPCRVVGVGPEVPCVGVLDPFLNCPIPEGSRCWLFLLPGSISGLRHHWSHGAFDGDRVESERWLREYAVRFKRYSVDASGNFCAEKAFEDLMEGLRHGELIYTGSDCHGLFDVEDAAELRSHAECWLGRRLEGWEDFTFSCSC